MKKFLVSIVLVLFLGGLFALESLPSDVVGFIKYGCVTVAGLTNLNQTVLAMTDASITDVTTFAAACGGETIVDQIAVWNEASQTWTASTYFFGAWSPNTALAVGDIVQVSAISDFDFYSVGDLPSPKTYSIDTIAGNTNLNMISIPLNKSAIVSVATLAADMGGETYVDQIAEWTVSSQDYNAATYFFGSWTPEFVIAIGDPIQVSAVQDFTWPTRNVSNVVTKVKKATMLK